MVVLLTDIDITADMPSHLIHSHRHNASTALHLVHYTAAHLTAALLHSVDL